MNFDLRWVALAIGAVVIASANRLPWPIVALVLAGGGVYLLRYGWQSWVRNGNGGRGKVVYWRGQRVEIGSPSRLRIPPWREIGPAAIYLLFGVVLTLASGAIILRGLGIG
jgi:hypothetical protein